MKRELYLAGLAAVSALAIGTAYAAQSGQNDALQIIGSKTSLTQAIAAAEKHVGGTASRAEYEHEKGKSVFEVEVVKDKSVMDVTVDPNTGQVIAAVADKGDHGDGRGDDHDKDD